MKNLMDKYLVERRDRREIDGGDYLWGLTSDGWNDEELDETGVMEFLDDIAKVAYELRNCRRGSYAKFGKTIKDLASKFKDISYDARGLASELKGYQ
jgi:hypothetical protein